MAFGKYRQFNSLNVLRIIYSKQLLKIEINFPILSKKEVGENKTLLI